MSNTTSVVQQKPKLSSNLKDRLKRCGRYHASPEQVTKQPKLMQKNTVDSDYPLLPRSMEPCAEVTDKEKTCSSLLTRKQTPVSASVSTVSASLAPMSAGISPLSAGITPVSDNINSKKSLYEIQASNGSLNKTPLSKKSGSCLSNVRGSKLVFEDIIDNKHKVQTKEISEKGSDNHAIIQKGTCDLVEKKDPSELVTKSNLLMQLSKKEEHLRKLRLVKMYRSKNNLEELQILIDRWCYVSQQALQDLHAAMPEPRPSLTELINHLGIDHHIVKFSVENDETFF